MLLFSVANGAMNVLRYWQRHNECLALLETAQKMPSGPLRPVQLHHVFLSLGRSEFHSELPTAVRGAAESLKCSHKIGAELISLKTSAAFS
jgi:hypothetical protein